jgi:hypothetical protein
MPIVFDEVDAVVQPSAEGSAGAAEKPSAGKDKPDPNQIGAELDRARRRRLRLLAD